MREIRVRSAFSPATANRTRSLAGCFVAGLTRRSTSKIPWMSAAAWIPPAPIRNINSKFKRSLNVSFLFAMSTAITAGSPEARSSHAHDGHLKRFDPIEARPASSPSPRRARMVIDPRVLVDRDQEGMGIAIKGIGDRFADQRDGLGPGDRGSSLI
jgi:hypothetical protein